MQKMQTRVNLKLEIETMKKIAVIDFKTNNNNLLRELSPAESETVSGGVFGAGLQIFNINTADIKNAASNIENTAEIFSIHDNKVGTLDLSRSVYLWVW